MKGLNKSIFIIVVLFICISVVFCTFFIKPDIQTATYDELIEIHGIGSILSERIELFLLENPDAKLADLDKVRGIGEGKIKLIAKKWRDK